MIRHRRDGSPLGIAQEPRKPVDADGLRCCRKARARGAELGMRPCIDDALRRAPEPIDGFVVGRWIERLCSTRVGSGLPA